MTDKILTDNEIVKALECCTTNGASCKNCPAFVKVDRSNCKKYFRGALDLINRLQAEVEKWQGGYMTQKQEIANLEIELKAMRGAANSYKAENERLKETIEVLRPVVEQIHIIRKDGKSPLSLLTAEIKAEAYKEFAEMFMQRAKETTINYVADASIQKRKTGWLEISKTDFDNLLKELVGEDDA